MVLADYPTNPKYSIGKAKRKPLYEFTNTPGPIYSQDNTANLKYHSEQKWKIGDSKRPPLFCISFDLASMQLGLLVVVDPNKEDIA